MKKNNIMLYLLSIVMLAFVIIFERIIRHELPNYSNLINISFWVLLTAFLLMKYGFSRDKSYYKKSTIQIAIIGILSYFIITYGLGIITGFGRNVFNLDILSILNNIIPTIVVIVCEEIIRYIYAKKCQNVLKPYIFLTVTFIFLNIVMEVSAYEFTNMEVVFKFVCLVVLPTIAEELLYSYITYKVSFVPTLIIKLVFGIYIFILPIFPDLGNYLTSLTGILYPALIYMLINKNIKTYDKNSKNIAKARTSYVIIPLIVILGAIVILVSGIFDYQLIAIGSGSMEPSYFRGDAVIFHKIDDLSVIEEGTIIAFKRNNLVITHRVVNISKTKKGLLFKTKGDNNDTEDNYTVSEKDVVGIVVYRIAYAGFPTLWINEQIDKL